jgi:hypothetical protein
MNNQAETSAVLDPEHWSRVGGREFQFFATDEEIRDWLLTALPENFAPYHLVGADVVAEGGRYVREPFRCELEQLPSYIRRSPPLRDMFDIWSEVLTPGLELRRGQRIEAVYSLNGLVGVQQGMMRRERRDVSRITVVAKVQHLATGKIVEHPGYPEVFESLRRAIKKAVCYTTIWIYPDGRELADDRLAPWTEGAVREYEAGVLFVARPGSRLEKRTTARKR